MARCRPGGKCGMKGGLFNPFFTGDYAGTGVEQVTVLEAEEQDGIQVDYNTAFASISNLPSTVDVSLSNGNSATLPVTWEAGSYDPDASPTADIEYILNGTFSDDDLPAGVTNPGGVSASIAVTVLAYTDAEETPTQVTWQAIGTAVEIAAGNTLNVSGPTHQANDIGIIALVHDPASGPADVVPEQSGWQHVSDFPQTVAAGGTSVRLNLLWKRSVTGSDLNFSYAVPSGQGHMYAVIFTVRGCYLVGSPFDVTDGQTKGTASTSLSITGVNANQNGNVVIYISGRGNDNAGANYSSGTNASLTGLTERLDAGTTIGTGSGLVIYSGTLATAGATGTLTGTISASTSEAMGVLTFKGVNNYAAPSVQSSNLSRIGDRQVQSSNPGSGSYELFIGNPAGAIDTDFLPEDGQEYSTGDEIGGGNVVIGSVTAGEIAIYDEPFSYEDTWAIRAFSYNIGGSGPLYNATTATNNPITSLIPAQDNWALNQIPITQPVRNLAHPEAEGVVAPVTKTFPSGFAETTTEYLQFIVGDNNGCRTSSVPEHLDMTYLRLKQKDDGLPFNEGWEWHEVDGDGLPVPILPGFVPSAVSGTTYQIWGCAFIVVSDTEIDFYYVENVGAISSRYSVGRGVLTKTGDVWSATLDASYTIANTQTRSYFFVRCYFSDALNKYVMVAPNVLTDKQEVWTSSDGISFTQKNTDLFSNNNQVASGAQIIWNEIGDMWEDGTWTYFYGSLEPQSPAYKGANGTTPIYENVYKKIALMKVLTADLDTDEATVLIEDVKYTIDDRGGLAIYPISRPITHDAVDHIICGRFNWKIEDQVGSFHQVPVDVCVLSETALVGTGQAQYGNDVYFDNMRIYRGHDPATGDTLNATATPYEALSGDTLTINGNAPTQYALTKVNMDGSSSWEDNTTQPQLDAGFDTNQFAVMGTCNSDTTGVKRYIVKATGFLELYLDTDNKLGCKVTGSGGEVKEYKVTGSGYANNVFDPAHTTFGMAWNNGTLSLFIDYSTIPSSEINEITDQAFTDVATPDVPFIMWENFDTVVGDVIPMWGSHATIANMITLI